MGESSGTGMQCSTTLLRLERDCSETGVRLGRD
jgi:hypothetical protein